MRADQHFGLVTGLSDHALDNTTAIAAVALGATIIEKHMTMDRNGGGPDDSYSLEPPEFAARGAVDYGRKSSERGNVVFRRSLYWVAPLKAGEVVTAAHVRSVRPGFGAAPRHLDAILGRTALRDIALETPVRLEDVGLAETPSRA